MDSIVSYFCNDRFVILKILSEHQIATSKGQISPLSQQEIADIAKFSKLKANRLLNELIETGYVDRPYGKRGKYAITEKGYGVLKLMAGGCVEKQ